MIKVTYDGSYPSTCMGTLTIYEDDKEIYSKKYCCSSGGSCYFENDYADEVVTSGKLTWNEDEACNFSKEIQEAVKSELSGFYVCCGGCL